jgi:hypothetical protein
VTRRSRSVAASFAFGVPLFIYLLLFNYTDAYEVGIARNRLSGDLWLQGAGMHWTSPWVAVARIDTRPQRVCVSTAGRGFSCKLVRFEPGAYKSFVAVEGFHYYWWANRVSFNGGYDDEYRGMRDLLRGYAYGETTYPFVVVLRNTADGAQP